MGVTKRYVLSLPERVVRSVLGLGTGVTRQLSEVALPLASGGAGFTRASSIARFDSSSSRSAERKAFIRSWSITSIRSAKIRERLYEVRPPATRAVRHGSCPPVFATAATFTGALLDKLDRRT